MDYPKFIVSSQKEESISIQRVNKHKLIAHDCVHKKVVHINAH